MRDLIKHTLPLRTHKMTSSPWVQMIVNIVVSQHSHCSTTSELSFFRLMVWLWSSLPLAHKGQVLVVKSHC